MKKVIKKARYGEIAITLSPDYKKAIIDLMKAECAMMGKIDGADVWYWGRCTISNLSRADCLVFEYGERDDMPNDEKGRFAILAD